MSHLVRCWLACVVGAWLLVQPASARTLVYCSEGEPEGFNPALFTSGTTFDAGSRQIFERLVEFGAGGTNIVPGLAESWTISDDGLTYTFRLRQGVRWQTTRDFAPTREFNADDVLFSFNRQWRETHPYYRVSGGTYPYFASHAMRDKMAELVRVDDFTVQFRLTRVEAAFLAELAMDFASVHSAEYADRMLRAGTPQEFDLRPVGTGPFVLTSYTRGSIIRYAPHPAYWRGPARDELVFAITPDAGARLAKLRTGECDVIAYPNPGDAAALARDARYRVLETPSLGVSYIALNTERPPFNDVRVRRALNLAVDKDAIIRAVFNGAALPAASPLPPAVWAYNEDVRAPAYDPAAARRLLAEVNLPATTTVTLWAMPVARPYNPNARLMAQLVQADLAAVGVRAEIVTYEWTDYLARSRNGEHGMLTLGWISDNGDPDNFLTPLFSCASAQNGENRARWCNPRMDALLREASRTTDVARRTALYREAQAIVGEELPWTAIAYPPNVTVLRAEVQGYQPNPFGLHAFYGASVN